MTEVLLNRTSQPAAPLLTVLGDAQVPLARVHEICGPARRTLAVLWARAMEQGPVIWVQPAWAGDRLFPAGLQCWADPARFIWVHPRCEVDVLWSLEEALRAGVGGVVVGDLPKPPGLTAVRRLHLAAEAGARLGGAPLAILLTPGAGGAPGVETRWHFAAMPWVDTGGAAPRFDEDIRMWQLERRRACMAPPAAWSVRAQVEAARISPLITRPASLSGAA